MRFAERRLRRHYQNRHAQFGFLLASGGFVLHERAMSGGHFEFRGGGGPRLAAPDRLALDPRAVGALDAALG